MGEVNISENTTGVIPSPYDSRDYNISTLVGSSKSTLPASYRVSVNPPVFSQGSVGCCVACALASCRYIQEVLQEGFADKFSVNYIYGNQYRTDTDEGMVPREGLSVLRTYGDCHWDDFKWYSMYPTAKSKYLENKELYDGLAYPYKIKSYYRLYNTEEIKTAVYNLGCAIVVYDVTDFLRSPVDGYVIQYRENTIVGQHCMTIVGWTEDDYWIVLNSWGTDYGIDGYCYIPFNYPIQESWTMVDELRYEELILEYDEIIFEKDVNKVRGIFLGIRRESKKRYVT